MGSHKHVPLSMFSWQGLSFLTSPIGSPSRLHPETAQCLNIDVAKIFVNVDLTKELPKRMNFNIMGEDVMVEYGYPRLPTKCLKCDKWGHAVKTCPMEKAVQKELEEGEICGENDKEEEIGRVEVQKIQEIEIVENGGGAKHVEVSEDVAIQEGDKQVSTKEISQDPEKEKEWLDVSPGKSSRPPTPLKFGQVSILTKSRFEVLSPMEEQEAIEDENLEQTEEEHEVIQEEDNLTRKMLPRESKVNHRYLRDKVGQKLQDVDPGYLNKKKPRRH